MPVDRSYGGGGGGGGGASEQFPVGMRVLAVDDDPFCLKLLHTLLQKCRYHVTSTSQAIDALKLLRENKGMFDLVISDVHMPDMDGFELLELVGLEMDLPVIMLSANDDTNLVMKGIIHGACDYLLKPVRMEELKNIWQHVVRKKKKVQPIGMNKFNKNGNESGQPLVVTEESDKSCKLNRKRKDQKEDDEEDLENGLSTEESATQKKARLIWSPELHRKFVAAVRTLGKENAVPKKILDFMNVEKLTRENVASHLQKYRKYLDRISNEANQQPNMLAAFGGADAAYMQMTSLGRFANLQNGAIRPFSSTGLLGSRLNTPAGLPMYTLPSSGTLQLDTQNLNGPNNNTQHRYQPVNNPGTQNEIVFQGTLTSFKYEQPLGKCDFSSPKSLLSPVSGNVNQSCGSVPSPNLDFPYEMPGFGRCTTSGSSSQPNPFTPRDALRTTITRDSGNILFPAHINSSMHSVNGPSDLRADFIQRLRSEENNFSADQNSNLVYNSMNSMISSGGFLDSLIEYNDTYDNINLEFLRNDDLNVVGMQSLADQQIMRQTMVDQSALPSASEMKQGYNLDQIDQLGGYSYNYGGSLEDLASAMVKPDQDSFM